MMLKQSEMGTSSELPMTERALVAGVDVRAPGSARGLAVRGAMGLVLAEHGVERDHAQVLCT